MTTILSTDNRRKKYNERIVDTHSRSKSTRYKDVTADTSNIKSTNRVHDNDNCIETHTTFLWPLCKSTWLEVVQRDCQARGLSKDDAMVRGRWKKMIRMVDEQEGCDWMNVSSGTSPPG